MPAAADEAALAFVRPGNHLIAVDAAHVIDRAGHGAIFGHHGNRAMTACAGTEARDAALHLGGVDGSGADGVVCQLGGGDGGSLELGRGDGIGGQMLAADAAGGQPDVPATRIGEVMLGEQTGAAGTAERADASIAATQGSTVGKDLIHRLTGGTAIGHAQLHLVVIDLRTADGGIGHRDGKAGRRCVPGIGHMADVLAWRQHRIAAAAAGPQRDFQPAARHG